MIRMVLFSRTVSDAFGERLGWFWGKKRVGLLDNDEQDLAVVDAGCSTIGAQGCSNNKPTTPCREFDALRYWPRMFRCVVFTETHLAKALSDDNPMRRRLPGHREAFSLHYWHIERRPLHLAISKGHDEELCVEYSGRRIGQGKIICIYEEARAHISRDPKLVR